MHHDVLLRVIALGVLAAPPSFAGATILTFDQERDAATQSTIQPASSGGTLPTDYGDRVTGAVMAVPGGFFTYGDGGEGFTPDVTVDIFSAAATATDTRVNLWQNGYGDLVNVIFAAGARAGHAGLARRTGCRWHTALHAVRAAARSRINSVLMENVSPHEVHAHTAQVGGIAA